MDLGDEDVSTRVLLRQVLHAEPPRSPITRSMAKELQRSSGTRQSARLRHSAAGLKSPHMALRQKLKDRLHESASRSPVQHKKRTVSVEASKNKPSAPALSVLLDEDDVTARELLRGILQTEPEMSLLVPTRPAKKDAEPGSANSSLHSNRPSVGTTDLELPDLTTASVTTAIRGISRKRPQKNIDLSVFVRKLDEGGTGFSLKDCCQGPMPKYDLQDSLSLKTPYVDPHTEKQGLRRAVKRRAIDVDNFEEGVQNHLARKMNPDMEQSMTPTQRMLSESRPLEKFTLGLTDLTAIDTSNIIMSSTALYPLPPSQDLVARTFLGEKDTVSDMHIQSNRVEEVHEQTEDKQRSLELAGCEGGEQEAEMGAEHKGADKWPSNNDEENLMGGVKGEEEMIKYLLGEEKLRGVEMVEESEQEQGTEAAEEQEVILPNEQEDIIERCIKELIVESEQDEERTAVQFQDQFQMEEEEKGKSQRKAGVSTSDPSEDQELSDPFHQMDGMRSEVQASPAQHIARQRAFRSEGGTVLPGKMEKRLGYRSLSTDLQHVDIDLGGVPEWVNRGQGDQSPEEEPSAAWQSGPEEFVKSQEVRSPLLPSSPHTRPLFLEPNDPLRNRLWTTEPIGASETEEGEVLLDTNRGIFTEDLQDKENWSPSRDVEPLQHDVSPLYTHTQGAADLGLTEASEEEDDDSKGESEGDDGSQSEELYMKTPAFVRQKRTVQTPDPQATPNFLKAMMNTRQLPQAAAAAKSKPPRKRKTPPVKKEPGLPRSYVMSIFKHFAKTKVSPDIYPVLKEIMDKYFDRLADDLEAYAAHARRRTIEVEDVELLLRRQGFVTDSMPVNVLIERHLPQEYRKLLIPVATSGNKIVPKGRRRATT
ncbi:centromere protein T isoform X1 [Arapaima gigas]